VLLCVFVQTGAWVTGGGWVGVGAAVDVQVCGPRALAVADGGYRVCGVGPQCRYLSLGPRARPLPR